MEDKGLISGLTVSKMRAEMECKLIFGLILKRFTITHINSVEPQNIGLDLRMAVETIDAFL